MIKTIITTAAIATVGLIAVEAGWATPSKADLGAFGMGGSFVNQAFGIQNSDPNFTRAAQVCRNNGYSQVRTHG